MGRGSALAARARTGITLGRARAAMNLKLPRWLFENCFAMPSNRPVLSSLASGEPPRRSPGIALSGADSFWPGR